MKIFTDDELEAITLNNKLDLGAITPLSEYEIICLKTGEDVTLTMLTRARAILALTKQISARDFVTRPELALILEEHTNLAMKTMLMFMALERRGLISDAEIYKIADELKEANNDESKRNRRESPNIKTKENSPKKLSNTSTALDTPIRRRRGRVILHTAKKARKIKSS